MNTTASTNPFGLTRLPQIARASGSCLYDTAGKRYLDGSGAAAMFALGHAHPEVNAAITQQLGQVACAYRHLFTSEALAELTALIVRRSGGELPHVTFSGSGSEAMEAAMKLALQSWHARGQPDKHRFIARRRSWHGTTLGALSVSGFAARRRRFEPGLAQVGWVSAANAYRPPPEADGRALVPYLAAELENTILDMGPQTVAAFVFEPVVGAAGGVVPAPAQYAQAVQAVCRKYGVLLIADEVLCGAGRCGTWRALEHDGVTPDIMAVGKGLAGGYIPLSATLCSEAVAAPILAADGAFQIGNTFSGHTAACAAGLAVQRIIERDALVERVQHRGETWLAALRDRLARFEAVGDVRGRGFLIGIELVRERSHRTPFPRALGLSARIGARAFADGLICYPCAGNVDGVDGDTLILAPPYNASDAELEEIIQKLHDALAAVLPEVTR